uniref:Uncharacterized protein n=1 Tax=Plectus sambesii TaxID=2011161 RepID=A0A914UQ20_9BILA
MATSNQRVLWACRHGERIDHIDANWRHTARAYDDPPLSDRGVIQAKETGERLKSEEIDFIFASPFERCVHTAQMIVDARDTPIAIFLEPGITEALMLCQNPPGWMSTQELKAKYPAVDETYEPICKELPPESATDMLACLPRIRDTLLNMVRKYKGNILIVSHAASIAASHGIFAEKRVWVNPGLLVVGNMSTSRTIWICRHGERVDNIDHGWGRSCRAWDDPPLSERGIAQAREVALRLKDEHIDHIISSPFERCVQTAQFIANDHSRPLHINLEHGICESLYLCQKPPGWLTSHELKTLYPNVNVEYEPMLKALAHDEPMGDDGCVPRVRETLTKLLKEYQGNILLVGHGSSIGALHEVLHKRWKYVGQCTLSKFVQVDDASERPVVDGVCVRGGVGRAPGDCCIAAMEPVWCCVALLQRCVFGNRIESPRPTADFSIHRILAPVGG